MRPKNSDIYQVYDSVFFIKYGSVWKGIVVGILSFNRYLVFLPWDDEVIRVRHKKIIGRTKWNQ